MNIIYKKNSDESIDVIAKRLRKVIEDTNFGILWELDLKDKLISKGFDYENDYLIFEICNPQKAKEILEINLDMGVFLPCKIVMYTEKNQTTIGMVNPTELTNLIEKSANSIAKEIEDELKTVIDTVAK